jgi:flagellar biosynthesis protein FlhF
MTLTTTTSNKTPDGIQRGKKYRFVVQSAEEAIQTLRERLGSDAKVLSVKQLGGDGLGKFLSSPKLEIIAMLPTEEEIPVEAPPSASKKTPVADPHREELDAEISSGSVPSARDRTLPYQTSAAKKSRARSNVWTVLKKAGFDDTLLGSLRYDGQSGSESLDDMQLAPALAEINRRLRVEYQAIESRPVTGKIAFFGTPGVGKTTALCKRLASDVFINRKSVEVLKLDSDTPNPDDALCLFCDVIGVPLQRDCGESSIRTKADVVYTDLPGMPVSEKDQWRRLRGRLDTLGIDTRVLVVSGMYEAALLGAAFDLGELMGATHLVLTHTDEMAGAAKLWPCVLHGHLTPFFASHGQNVTSDYSEDVLRVLLEKTFPANLID